MVYLILGVLLLAAIALPGLWVRWVLQKYSQPADRYRDRGSGAELARHLLDRFELQDVAVEVSPLGDHYDPDAKAVRLTQDKFDGHSLTAVTVAAHEVGHAIQDARGETLFRNRQNLAKLAMNAQRIASVAILAAPLVAVITRAPGLSVTFLVLAIGSMLIGTAVHLLTLPVEFDASFRKAPPLLADGGYLHDGDLPHANSILRAAAFTYVAASLASLLNVGRWVAVLRR
ncbi:MAG: zinc metallopeptidase [Pseudomonadota bacterium]